MSGDGASEREPGPGDAPPDGEPHVLVAEATSNQLRDLTRQLGSFDGPRDQQDALTLEPEPLSLCNMPSAKAPGFPTVRAYHTRRGEHQDHA